MKQIANESRITRLSFRPSQVTLAKKMGRPRAYELYQSHASQPNFLLYEHNILIPQSFRAKRFYAQRVAHALSLLVITILLPKSRE